MESGEEVYTDWSRTLGEIASVLTFCGLPREVAGSVVAEYAQRRSYGEGHFPPVFPAQRPRPPVLRPPVVVACDATVDLPDGRARMGQVVFEENSCEFAVRYEGWPSWTRPAADLRGPRGRPRRPGLTVTDDRSATTDAYPGSGGIRPGGWRGRWRTRFPLSATTRWLELAGVRVPLGQAAPLAEVRIEALPDEPMAQRYLWHRLALVLHGPPEDDLVADVFLELSGLAPDDPMLAELSALTAARYGRPDPEALRTVRPPWPRLYARLDRRDGPVGDIPLTATTPEIDGIALAVYAMRSEPEGLSLSAHAAGDLAAEAPDPDILSGVRLAWWAEDDRGNPYLGNWNGGSGWDGNWTGTVEFTPPLDPTATRLQLRPTGLRHRALIDIPLPPWPRP